MRKENDFYPTPHEILKAIMANCLFDARVSELCAGDGRIVVYLSEAGISVVSGDIATGQDFFDLDSAPTDQLFTNPPFKKIREFIDHAFAIGFKRLILVCPERLWACGKGLEQFRRHKPSKWINLTWREDYLQKGGSPDRALAIAVWDSPCADKCEYDIWERVDDRKKETTT